MCVAFYLALFVLTQRNPVCYEMQKSCCYIVNFAMILSVPSSHFLVVLESPYLTAFDVKWMMSKRIITVMGPFIRAERKFGQSFFYR